MFIIVYLDKSVNVLFVKKKNSMCICSLEDTKLSTYLSITNSHSINYHTYEPCREKTCLQGCRQGPTQPGLYSHRRWLEAGNFGFRKYRNSTIYVAKTKALISCVVTVADLHLCFSICKQQAHIGPVTL